MSFPLGQLSVIILHPVQGTGTRTRNITRLGTYSTQREYTRDNNNLPNLRDMTRVVASSHRTSFGFSEAQAARVHHPSGSNPIALPDCITFAKPLCDCCIWWHLSLLHHLGCQNAKVHGGVLVTDKGTHPPRACMSSGNLHTKHARQSSHSHS